MTKKLPTYSLHKASGNARVWLNGKNYYLGEYGSPESRLRYAELLKKQTTGELVDPVAPHGPQDTGPTVNEVCVTYIVHARTYYQKNGRTTAEYDCIRSAMRPLVDLFGDSPAKDFDSVALRMVRQRMIDTKEWCRDYINKSLGRLVRVFRHAAKNKLVPASTLTDLELVEPLESGRTAAKDYAPRTEVPATTLEAIKAVADPMTRDMIDLALLTGARGGELVGLTDTMIDKTGEVWFAVLVDHKMRHKGKSRALVFGPKSIAILRRYATADGTQRLFPVQRRTFTDRIKRCCELAKVPMITSHWLRHSAATTMRRDHGLDAAQVLLGHSNASTTEKYAHLDLTKAIAVARACG